jgi:hypothetical protein
MINDTILRRCALWALIIGLSGVVVGFAPAALQAEKIKAVTPPMNRKAADEAAQWGIHILHLRFVAENHLLDLRFQVSDHEKASTIMSRKHSAYLVDQKTGQALPVPITKSGAMRQTTPKPENGREYFMFFSNTGDLVKPGDLMTLAIADIRIPNIPVEETVAPLDPQRQETLQQNQIKAWQTVRTKLRQEFEQCRLGCKGDAGCLEQCGVQLAEQEKSEYMRLVYGKAESPPSQ